MTRRIVPVPAQPWNDAPHVVIDGTYGTPPIRRLEAFTKDANPRKEIPAMSTATKTETTNGASADADPFDTIPVDTLPTPTVGGKRTAEDDALASRFIVAMSATTADGKPQAARERTVHADRAAANKRAAAIKRLVNGAKDLPEGKRAASRIVPVPAGGFQVAVLFVDAPAAATNAEATATPTA